MKRMVSRVFSTKLSWCLVSVWLLGALNLTAATPVKPTGKSVIRVMTYNIQHGRGADGRVDDARICQVIQRAKVDFCGLNEVDIATPRSNFSQLDQDLRRFLRFGAIFAQAIPMTNPNGAPGAYGVMAAAPGKLFVMAQIRLPLPLDWEQRTALIVRTAEPKPIYFIVTHLPWEGDNPTTHRRLECIKYIEQYVIAHKYFPAVLLGDLNSTPNSPEIAYLRQNWTISNDVNPQNSHPADRPTMLLDYVAFMPKSSFKVVKCEVLPEPEASDHRPVVVELQRQNP